MTNPTPEEKCKCWCHDQRQHKCCSPSPEARCEHDGRFRGVTLGGDTVEGYLSVLTQNVGHVEAGHYISNKVGLPFAYAVRPESVNPVNGSRKDNEARVDWNIQIRDAVFQFRGDKLTPYVMDVICKRIQILIQAAFEKGREAR